LVQVFWPLIDSFLKSIKPVRIFNAHRTGIKNRANAKGNPKKPITAISEFEIAAKLPTSKSRLNWSPFPIQTLKLNPDPILRTNKNK
jgi:hypothetical protein